MTGALVPLLLNDQAGPYRPPAAVVLVAVAADDIWFETGGIRMNGAVHAGLWIGQMGEEKPIATRVTHASRADLSASTATFEVWDSAGEAILEPAEATVEALTDGTYGIKVSYSVTLKTDGTIEAAGAYRGIFRVSTGTAIRHHEIDMTVLARPD